MSKRRKIQKGLHRLDGGIPGWFRNPKSLVDSPGLLEKGIYPWTNWKWEDLDSFSLQIGFIKHFWTHDDWEPYPDTHEGGIPNWPKVRVHDNGSGQWFLFVDLDLQPHGFRHRRMVIENTKDPFSIYHAQLQYGHGAAEIEVNHAENVAVYGIKNERPVLAFWVRNSSHVLMTGVGGPSTLNRDRGKIIPPRR